MGNVGLCSQKETRSPQSNPCVLNEQALGLQNYQVRVFFKDFYLDHEIPLTIDGLQQKMKRDGHEMTANCLLFELLSHPIMMKQSSIDKRYFLGIGLFCTKGTSKQKAQIFLRVLSHIGNGIIYQSQFQQVMKALTTLAVACIPVLTTLKYFPGNSSKSQMEIEKWVRELGTQIFRYDISVAMERIKFLLLKEFKFIFNHNELREKFNAKIIPTNRLNLL